MCGPPTDLRYQRISYNILNIYLMFPISPVVLFNHCLNLLLDLLPHLLCFLLPHNLKFPCLNKALFRVLQDLTPFLGNPLKWMSMWNTHQMTYRTQNLSFHLKCNLTTHQ